MPFRKVIDVDFSSLYPNVMKNYGSLYQKIKLKRDRLEKLNKLENLNNDK